jgi:hypothetical protein
MVKDWFRIDAGCPKHSPWGKVQTGHEIAPGIFRVTCSNHGGLYVPPEQEERIPQPFRHPEGWYEEDEAVDIVYWFIPRRRPTTPASTATRAKHI